MGEKKQVPAAKKTAARVLVVEVEPTVAALIADVLRDEGMSVDVLLNSQSALRKVETVRYDLLICDLKMPGVDGQTFYRMLGQRHNPLHDRVLFVAGDVLAPRSQEFLERDHLPHVAKPFRVEELSRAVQEVLQVKKSAPAGPEMTTKHAAGDG
jgi:CheY-like chemotaxis protein